MAELLPWQENNWAQLIALHQAGRLPHALLLHGLPGTGLRQFAARVASVLLCREAGGLPCGACQGCRLLEAGTHPDLLQLEPENPFGPIKVDQVRGVVEFAHGTAQLGGYRVIVLCPTESMNANAANALLKILEEPGADTLLMLLTYAPAAVLPTIRSRCQSLAMQAPDGALAREWLRSRLEDPAHLDILHQFAPRQPLEGQRLEAEVEQLELVARSLPALIEGRASPLQTARAWSGVEPARLLLWLYQWLSAACLCDARGDTDGLPAQIYASWKARPGGAAALLAILDEVLAMRRQVAVGSNPNKDLLLETLAFRLAPGGEAA